MTVSLGLTGLEFSCDLGTACCGGWGQRPITVSSVGRTVAVEGMYPKTIVLLFGFLCLEAKYHLAFCWLQLAAVVVAVFPLSRHLGSVDCPPALQWDPRLS